MLDLDELSVGGKADKVHFASISDVINEFIARKEKEEKQTTVPVNRKEKLDFSPYWELKDTTDYDKLHHDHVQY